MKAEKPSLNQKNRIAVYLARAALFLILYAILHATVLHPFFIHPVARLHRSIKIGDSYDHVREIVFQHCSKYSGVHKEVNCEESIAEKTIFGGEIKPTKSISVYHIACIADQQLQVFFDENDKVKEKIWKND